MIYEPYICKKGHPNKLGKIEWRDRYPIHTFFSEWDCVECTWQPYADFEREKFKTLGRMVYIDNGQAMSNGGAFVFGINTYDSLELIGYSFENYDADSESNRLLKRAEFLKAVCEKEGVEWLPKTTDKQEEPRWYGKLPSWQDSASSAFEKPKQKNECRHNAIDGQWGRNRCMECGEDLPDDEKPKQEECDDCQTCRYARDKLRMPWCTVHQAKIDLMLSKSKRAEIDDKFEFREQIVEQVAAALSTVKQQGFDLNNGTLIFGEQKVRFTTNFALNTEIDTKAQIIAARALAVLTESGELKKIVHKIVRNAKRSKR